ncbi:MAG: molybdopterin-dependent oxidoreductase alpha subunit [Salibacteraceae bacterium]|jgi:molybdopterin-dependent oxidoreductase alpha subunit
MIKRTNAQPPVEFTGLKSGKIESTAAGFKAVTSAVAHVLDEMDLPRALTVLNNMNQKDGFDCSGCAWPDPDGKRSGLGEYCENGAKAIAEEATTKRVGPDFFAKHSVEEMGSWSDYRIGKSGRITHPMVLKPGDTHYSPIEWSDAFTLIANELNKQNSPNEAIFYTSGRTSNEAAYLYQLFVREYGTNNLPDCSNMCHESSGAGLSETVGIGKGSVTLADFEHAEVVIVMGQNPGTNHPRMLSALEDTKKNGGKIISVNPLPEAGLMNFKHPQKPAHLLGKGVKLTDLFLQVKINGDVALLKAWMILMLEAENKNKGQVFDLDFIEQKTSGIDALLADLESQNFNELVQQAGLQEAEVREAAQLLIEKKKIIICWAMGLTQHKNGVHNIREIVNLLLLKGSIGKKGAGTCPVRGHSNVQGDRTMGIWEKPKPQFLDNLKKEFNFDPPRAHGFDVVEAIEAMHQNKAKVFMGMGGNFISATPDTEFTAQALRACDLTVQVSTKLNRSHIIHGKTALILPCITRSEKDVQNGQEQIITVEDSMGVVHFSKGKLDPLVKGLLSETAIVARLAQATFKQTSQTNWAGFNENYDLVRDKIEATIPGFDNFNERVRKPGGFYLPNNSRTGDFTPTKTGKANFTVNQVSQVSVSENELAMMTIRTHDQFNTTIYGLDDRYRGIYNERRVILMNPKDIEKQGLMANDIVDITSEYQGEVRVAEKFIVYPYDIPEKCTATYFPETNVLVSLKNKAEISNTPASKLIVVTLKKSLN